MGLDPANLPENYRRCMVRDPVFRQATPPKYGSEVIMRPDPAPGEETEGTIMAREARKLGNAVTEPEREELLAGAMRAIYAEKKRDSITFWVDGKPEPAGSKQAFCPTNKQTGEPYRGTGGRIIINVVDDNPKSKEWKKTVARAARQHFTRAPHDGPVECRFEFVVTRPQYHFGTGKNAECLKDSAPHFPTAKPDTTKLTRGTEDALTGICWLDDAQIVEQRASKRYGTKPGVQITITPVTVINQGNATPTATQPELPMEPVPKPPEEELPPP